MDVRYLKVLLLCMTRYHIVLAVISTTHRQPGYAYEVTKYKDRAQRSECTLYTSMDQGEVNCGRKCNQHESACLFYSLQGKYTTE